MRSIKKVLMLRRMCLLCNKGMIKSSNLLRSCILISPIFDDPGKVEGVVFGVLVGVTKINSTTTSS